MSQALWARRPLPPVDARVAGAWTAEVRTRAGITASRIRLHDELGGQHDVDEADVEVLLLTFEELTSNAVRHGRLPVRVTVTTTADGWLIDVADAATDRGPVPAQGRDPARGGLGLYLVARLCAAHGWSVERGRKHVWACVRRSAVA